MSPAKKKPSVADLLGIIEKAHEVFATLPPAAVNIPALKELYDLSKYHGVAPKNAPHIPDDGKI